LNNLKITSLSTKAVVSASANEIQIASKQSGSDGWVHITGGKVNSALRFPTTNVKGLRGYAYYTGLTKLVHKVIYGDERDLAAYPGVGAAGIKFKILAPTKAEIDFSVRVKLVAGTALSTVETVVKSAVTTYVNSLGVGDDVVLASIIERLMVLPQVTDAYIDTPTANVAIADNELARTRSDLITVVGVV
jgi:hypothetical protein